MNNPPDAVFSGDNLADGEKCSALGPHYFSARDFMERTMKAFEAEHFEPLLKKFSDEFYERLQAAVQDSVLNDTEMNCQLEIWRTVDTIVKGILSGEKWIVARYVLGENYECDKVRAEVARHVPRELQDARIADLEKEVKSLKQSLEWARR